MELDAIVSAVKAAHDNRRPLRIRGGGSKDFYGGMLAGEVLDCSGHRGIIEYEPTELFIRARGGTPLAEIELALAERGQGLPFEPPRFGRATLGGGVAAGLSGPRRQQAGAVRDFVLGVTLVDGTGQTLVFGGQVMKNVAGYDVSRLMAGSLGTLGVLTEVTLKVLPRPVAERTLVFELDEASAIARLNAWGGQPLPVSASFWHAGRLWLRLSGAAAAVDAATARLGGAQVADAEAFWDSVREQTHPAFAGELLWRLALPTRTPPLGLCGLRAIEWGGGLRWYAAEAADPRGAASGAGGHAVLYRAPESQRLLTGAFAPLPAPLLALHRRLKEVFDPRRILNPGRLYAEF